MMDTKDLTSVIAGHPFFQGLSPKFIDLIKGCARIESFDADELLCREGRSADVFYVLREGQVAIESFAPSRGGLRLQTLENGELLGWSWFVPPYRWRFDARALKPTVALAFDAICLRDKCEVNPSLGYDLLKRISAVVSSRLEASRMQVLGPYGTAAIT